jgi:hypothetical protein
MNTRSHLEQARTYEFNAMQAKQGGDEQLASRYEYMSKMSMIDATRCFERESKYYSNPNINHNIDFSGNHIPTLIGICVGLFIPVFVYFIT